MVYTWRRWQASALVLVFSAVAVLATGSTAQDSKAKQSGSGGRPPLQAAGRAVVLPAGVQEAPKDLKGALGIRPLALVRRDGKVVAEAYAVPLKGAAAVEAKEFATSADASDKIEVRGRGTVRHEGKEVEVVTLRLNLKSPLGTPWVIHSVYFPAADGCAGFKLVAGDAAFESVLPTFEEMLGLPKGATRVMKK